MGEIFLLLPNYGADNLIFAEMFIEMGCLSAEKYIPLSKK